MFGIDPDALPRGLQFAPEKKQGRGMFAEGGTGRAIAGMIGDFLLQNAGMKPVYQPTMLEKQKLAQQEAQYQRQRQDQNTDWLAHQEYEAAHRPPDELTRLMQAAGIDPSSEQAKAMFLGAAQNKANPFTQMRVQNPDGSETLQFMRPPMAPAAPVGKLTPLGAGGPGLDGPGGFPGL